jgi:hypothetical protein
MPRPRTHFELVPLAVAKKILADEIKKKQAAERAEGSTDKELEEAPVEKTRLTIERK